MSARELVVLGSASQLPTRRRNQNGYLVRWDEESLLFDPGEGTQRQMTFAGVSPASITRICITHLHGDHCLGLPGILQRLSLDRVAHPVDLYYPASGQEHIDRLRHSSISVEHIDLRCHPVDGEGPIDEHGTFTLVARRLDHVEDAIGYQLVEPERRHLVPERLDEMGIAGPRVGELQRTGRLHVGERTVTVDEVSTTRPGQRFAFVMDTRPCEGATALADGADLMVCEATYLEPEAHLAAEYGHMTARQAAQVAAAAGARRLVLSHLSERYHDGAGHLAEASAVFADVIVAEDLLHVEVPPRR